MGSCSISSTYPYEAANNLYGGKPGAMETQALTASLETADRPIQRRLSVTNPPPVEPSDRPSLPMFCSTNQMEADPPPSGFTIRASSRSPADTPRCHTVLTQRRRDETRYWLAKEVLTATEENPKGG